jgi:ketosteroid isomerase-like protein
MTDLLTTDFAIRQLHGRYVDAVFRKDVAAFSACWADNAEWFIAGRHFAGRDAIAEGFLALAGYAERVLMMLGMPVLDIGTGTARGRWPVTELIKRADGGHTRTVGVYEDRYVGSGLDWRFAERRWTLHYRGAGDFSDAFEVVADPGPPPGSG